MKKVELNPALVSKFMSSLPHPYNLLEKPEKLIILRKYAGKVEFSDGIQEEYTIKWLNHDLGLLDVYFRKSIHLPVLRFLTSQILIAHGFPTEVVCLDLGDNPRMITRIPSIQESGEVFIRYRRNLYSAFYDAMGFLGFFHQDKLWRY